jgi:uncharacterized protein (DUF1501 family)
MQEPEPMTTRREFLGAGLGVALTLAAPRLAPARVRPVLLGRTRPRALCLVQLTGGNDGLGMLVPWRQDAYWRARPTLAAPPGELHALDAEHSLHPAMGALAALAAEGRAAFVHAVGHPEPDRSHFRSMEIWHTARLQQPCGELGWFGLLADRLAEGDGDGSGALVALHVGSAELPLALRARRVSAPCLIDADGLRVPAALARLARARDALCSVPPETDGLPASAERAFLRSAARASYRAAERMSALVAAAPRTTYPEGELARRLRLAARLIAGGFGARLFHLELAGFDTHARQGRVHAALLGELSLALAAFQQDLEDEGVADDVVTLVFSEFGRRVAENASRGTDHGQAAPVIVLGSRVRAGCLGTAPDLERLDDGDVPWSTDFRALYAGLERDWFGLAPTLEEPPFPLFL